MPIWKLTLAYNGTAYNGWQVQPGLPTVQGTLAAAIHRITGETVLPQGSGRTDAGVHALAQVASFELSVPIPAANLHHAMNRALPPNIRVLTVAAADSGFHARHSAKRKTYEYRLFPGGQPQLKFAESICSPMLAPFVWDCPWPVDLRLMRAAADDLLGEHDFTSFAASDPDLATRARSGADVSKSAAVGTVARPNTRTISRSDWIVRDELYIYTVTGSGFLHHMVRNLVGSLVDIGAERLRPDSIPALLAARDRSAASPTAPARGLFLVNVEY